MTDEQKFWYLFWAYDIIWLLMAGYILSLGIRQNRLRKLIDRLKKRLEDSSVE